MSINAEIQCEDTGSVIHLTLTPDEYQRVLIDADYLQNIVNQYRLATSQSAEAERQSEATTETPPSESSPFEDTGENSSSFIWTNSAVLLLLSLYEDHIEDFNVKRHKKVWQEIAKRMKETNSTLTVTGLQCQTKLNGLKRTYKKIVDHNNTSGNDRASWPFFERMHEIFSGTRWAQPLAVASERGPFPYTSTSQSNENQTNENQTNENQENTRSNKKRKLDVILENYVTEMKTYNEKKREERMERFNKIMEMKEKHHKEKVMLLQQLLNRRS